MLSATEHMPGGALTTPQVLSGERPRYADVYQAIADDIAAGRLSPGERLPVERVIADRFGVSRDTVRRALHRLAEEGMVTLRANRGAYVARGPVGEQPNILVGLSALAGGFGYVVTSRVLSAGVRAASLDEAEQLLVAPGSNIFALARVRLMEGLPIAVERNRIAIARAPGVDTADYSTESLYQVLEQRCGVIPSRAEFVVEAIAAGPDEAALLDVPVGAPILRTRDTMFDQEDRPVSIDETHYRGDRYRFRTSFSRARWG